VSPETKPPTISGIGTTPVVLSVTCRSAIGTLVLPVFVT
jgi:hypothetical protein